MSILFCLFVFFWGGGLLLTQHALIKGDLNARNQPNAFEMGGDLNAWNPT